jgi:hypothetical protein
MRIIVFVTDGDSVHPILEYIGENADPPQISPARGPPAWEGESDSLPLYDPVAQLESDFPFDQTQGGESYPESLRTPSGTGGTSFLHPAVAPWWPPSRLRRRWGQ